MRRKFPNECERLPPMVHISFSVEIMLANLAKPNLGSSSQITCLTGSIVTLARPSSRSLLPRTVVDLQDPLQMQSLVQSSQKFSATQQPFPKSLTTNPTQVQPSRGVIDLHGQNFIPPSLSTALPLSRTPYPELLAQPPPQPETLDIETQLLGGPVAYRDELPTVGPIIAKRRCVIPEVQRRRQAIRTCRRCGEAQCPGNSNISNCPQPCEVPCKTCGHTEGCRGVDNGRICTLTSN